MRTERLTQVQILRAARAYKKEHGEAPTQRSGGATPYGVQATWARETAASPSVHYHITGMTKRCQGFNDLKVPTASKVKAAVVNLSQEHQEVVLAMYKHGHQSQAARDLGTSQGCVRHRFRRALTLLEDSPVREWLIRHTVVEPQWSVVELKWFDRIPKRLPSPAGLRKIAENVLRGQDLESIETLAPDQAWEYVAA